MLKFLRRLTCLLTLNHADPAVAVSEDNKTCSCKKCGKEMKL